MLKKIKKLCAERKESISDLERACGLAQRTVYRWDKVKPSVDKVAAVAEHFGVSIDELLRDDSVAE